MRSMLRGKKGGSCKKKEWVSGMTVVLECCLCLLFLQVIVTFKRGNLHLPFFLFLPQTEVIVMATFFCDEDQMRKKKYFWKNAKFLKSNKKNCQKFKFFIHQIWLARPQNCSSVNSEFCFYTIFEIVICKKSNPYLSG